MGGRFHWLNSQISQINLNSLICTFRGIIEGFFSASSTNSHSVSEKSYGHHYNFNQRFANIYTFWLASAYQLDSDEIRKLTNVDIYPSILYGHEINPIEAWLFMVNPNFQVADRSTVSKRLSGWLSEPPCLVTVLVRWYNWNRIEKLNIDGYHYRLCGFLNMASHTQRRAWWPSALNLPSPQVIETTLENPRWTLKNPHRILYRWSLNKETLHKPWKHHVILIMHNYSGILVGRSTRAADTYGTKLIARNNNCQSPTNNQCSTHMHARDANQINVILLTVTLTLLAMHVAVARLTGRWQGGAFCCFFWQKQFETGSQEPCAWQAAKPNLMLLVPTVCWANPLSRSI